MNQSRFFSHADLMLRVLPYIGAEKCLALKGGTAINFFIKDLPRLSVDIDLTYLPLESREASLQAISEALSRIAQAIRRALPGVRVQENYLGKPQRISKLFVREQAVQIKIEPNEVLRGSVYPPEEQNLSRKAEESYGHHVSIKTLSPADLYGGKLCAALDRQHPRDFFDIKILLEEEGITEGIRKAFVVYLASSDRPMHEILAPIRRDFRKVYETEFLGMALTPVGYEELEEVREVIIRRVRGDLTAKERQFLISLKDGSPRWDLLGLPGVERLPGLQWKLANIRQMDKRKHGQMIAKLRKVLNV